MRRLFIVRHGKTAWNLEKRLQGAGADSPLLTDDVTPYQQLAAYLDQYPFAAAYSSPLARAYDTATLTLQNFSQHPIPKLEAVDDLRELSFGRWEGRTRAELMTQAPELFRLMSKRQDDPRLAGLGMENFHDARRRFAGALAGIAASLGDDENALIFAHGGISQIGIQEATGNPHLLGLKNLSTSILAVAPEGLAVDAYNQTAYLKHVDLNEGNVSII